MRLLVARSCRKADSSLEHFTRAVVEMLRSLAGMPSRTVSFTGGRRSGTFLSRQSNTRPTQRNLGKTFSTWLKNCQSRRSRFRSAGTPRSSEMQTISPNTTKKCGTDRKGEHTRTAATQIRHNPSCDRQHKDTDPKVRETVLTPVRIP